MSDPESVCYICHIDGPMEEHHLVPRAYGGRKGKTKPLCRTCHFHLTKASRLKEITLINLRSINPLWSNSETATRATELANIIQKSRKLTESDRNKAMLIQQRLAPADARKLRSLSRVFHCSLIKAIEISIDRTYRSIKRKIPPDLH